MTITLFVRVILSEPNGKRCARLGKVLVTDFEKTTDEMCETALNSIAEQMLHQHPAGSQIAAKEFISESDFNAYNHIANATAGNNGKNKQVHTIYMKASGLFPDPDNIHGFGVTGPDIPFYLHSSIPYEELDENDKQELTKHAQILCRNKFSRTPKGITFIGKNEYLRLVDVIQSHQEKGHDEGHDKKIG